jgi:MFS family permease
VIGNLVLQWPIGWMADHLDRRAVLAACAASSAALVALVTAIDAHSNAVLIVLLLWGGISFGIYTVGLAVLGQRFSGGDIARANAAFTMVYTLGGLIGRPISGAAMDAFGRSGLTLSVSFFYAAAAVAALLAFHRRG